MQGQIIYKDRYDSKGYTDENSLSNALITQPDVISTVITHLGGRDSDKFPLTFLTEGQNGGTDGREVQDAQFTWPVQRRSKKSDVVVSHGYVSTDKPGVGRAPFYVVFASRWLIEQSPIVSRSGTKARVMAPPIQVANGYQYKLILLSGNQHSYCPFSDLVAGSKWSMTGPGIVSESKSKGNRSNAKFPGKMKNQLNVMRKSYRWDGNVSNRIVEVEFMTGAGKKTTLWLEYEMWQHHMEWMEMCEEWMWESLYNRNEQGEIDLIDEESGLPIPIGAGIFQQVPHDDTYGQLTYKKLYQLIGDSTYGATDADNKEFVMYCGEGFANDFDDAMKAKAAEWKVIEGGTGDKFLSGSSNALVLGGFFKTFVHNNGSKMTVVKAPIFDFGGRAEAADRHPISGLPMTSHEAVFIDQSVYDGKRNVQMVKQKGRGLIIGAEIGMAPAPFDNFAASVVGNKAKVVSTDLDSDSVHYLGAKTVNIFRNEFCLHVKCNLS